MLTLNEVQREIVDLENQELDLDGYVALSALYTIEDRIIEIEELAQQQRGQGPEPQETDGNEKTISRSAAERILSGLKNPDGTLGPHWTLTDANTVAARNEFSGSPVNFWVAMCLIYAEYSDVAKALGVNNMDFYVGMTKSFLNDENSVDGKIKQYCQHILKD